NKQMPSLASLIEATADAYTEHTESYLDEARSFDASPESNHHEERPSEALWDIATPETDSMHGGLQELPKHPNPQLLWSMLSAPDTPEDAQTWVRVTLTHMKNGGINDQ